MTSSVKQPEQQKVGSIVDANFPQDAEGRVYHVGVKKGEGKSAQKISIIYGKFRLLGFLLEHLSTVP